MSAMNASRNIKERDELHSIIKSHLEEIGADTIVIRESQGLQHNAQFVYLQFLKQTIKEEGDAWIYQYYQFFDPQED